MTHQTAAADIVDTLHFQIERETGTALSARDVEALTNLVTARLERNGTSTWITPKAYERPGLSFAVAEVVNDLLYTLALETRCDDEPTDNEIAVLAAIVSGRIS